MTATERTCRSSGRPYATVRADVADYLQAGTPGVPLTVGGTRIEGPQALTEEAAKFYAERCYLDQASLGRLLEFYQARVGNEESALAKFVNELLGLEKLDALRDGLSDANDLRLLKKLAVGVDDAATKAKAAATQLKEQSELLAETRSELAQARATTREAIAALRPGATDDVTDSDLLGFVRSALSDDNTRVASAGAATLHQELIALGGRISALSERPSTQRIQETRTALASATAEQRRWDATEGATVRAWEAAAQAAGVKVRANRALLSSRPRTSSSGSWTTPPRFAPRSNLSAHNSTPTEANWTDLRPGSRTLTNIQVLSSKASLRCAPSSTTATYARSATATTPKPAPTASLRTSTRNSLNSRHTDSNSSTCEPSATG